MAILYGREFNYVIVLGKKEYNIMRLVWYDNGVYAFNISVHFTQDAEREMHEV